MCFFESTLAKQIAMIEANLKEPVVSLGCLDSIRTFQDARDAVRAYYLLALEAEKNIIKKGEAFNIAGEEIFKLTEVVDIFLDLSFRNDISVVQDINRLRPIDADYQMFDNSKIKATISWKPEISALDMFKDLLDHWREVIGRGNVPIDR